MIDTTWIDSRYGMSLTPGPHATPDNMNGVLFYIEYILMKEAAGQDVSVDVAEFKLIIENIRTYAADGSRIPGLYDRFQGDSQNPNKTDVNLISHDNMTAIAAFSARYGSPQEGLDLVVWGLKHFDLYDNVYPASPRLVTIQWPTDWAFWAMTSKKWYLIPLWLPWMPLWVLRCFISDLTSASNTSEKLLNFVQFAAYRDKSLPMKILWKLFAFNMKLQYGSNWINQLMTIYFADPTHPNNVISQNLVIE